MTIIWEDDYFNPFVPNVLFLYGLSTDCYYPSSSKTDKNTIAAIGEAYVAKYLGPLQKSLKSCDVVS